MKIDVAVNEVTKENVMEVVDKIREMRFVKHDHVKTAYGIYNAVEMYKNDIEKLVKYVRGVVCTT